jgi:L-histidine N-alpha-methyltransferase
VIHISVHPSQYPDRVRADLIDSLRQRRIKHKFHYDSYKQAEKWLALHQAWSPARNDPACAAIYDQAFARVADRYAGSHDRSAVHVVGLGCGGGHKDTALIDSFRRGTAAGADIIYTAIDVSMPLVITARQRAAALAQETHGVICDLELANDIGDELSAVSSQLSTAAPPRIFTFFGMLPNSEPEVILPQVRKLLRHNDILILNANLAPGSAYREGVQRVLTQYDNALTSDWLTTFLYDLGVERSDGELQFAIKEGSHGLLRIEAAFAFAAPRTISLAPELFKFVPGEMIQLFYSYRYTPERLARVLTEHNLAIREQWITPSGEEGVFIVQG